MKKFTILLLVNITLLSNYGFSQILDAVSMGAGYANEIYYSFDNGEVKSEARDNWDIAFYTTAESAGIIINDGNGVALYNYPYSDISEWMSMDTTGISEWKPLYNSEESWETGAFNHFDMGYPDYGWGVYDEDTDEVIGDSLYFIKLSSGIYMKLCIEKKNSIDNIYYFKYANLDNSNETSVTLDCNNYSSKNFAYYSIESGQELDREPDTATWDILFTKYQAFHPAGSYVQVTGVCSNLGVYANKFYPVADDFEDWSTKPLDSAKTAVGWNWKYFDMGLFQYIIEDSTAFFVSTRNSDIYKLTFVDFGGSSNGNIILIKKKLSTVGIFYKKAQAEELDIYPNPATDIITINTSNSIGNNASLRIFSMNGEEVYENNGLNSGSFKVSLSGWTKGMYVVVATVGNKVYNKKLIVN